MALCTQKRTMTDDLTLETDGLRPERVVIPQDGEEIARLLKQASDEERAVAPVGGATMLELGGPLSRTDLALSTRNLNRIVDYQPANLTVRAEAGISLAALNQALAEQGQFLPLDPYSPMRATLGGILATNASGPLRVRYGSARDLLIGIQVALADGQIVHGGGQVVKNVAGYDLPKLFIGSLGTLGVILEATFKVAPLPTTTATLLAGFDRMEQAAVAAQRILHSPLLPSGLDILSPAASAFLDLGDSYVLAIRFGGIGSTVRRELQDAETWSRENGAVALERMEDDEHLWGRIRDFSFESRVVVKIGTLPTQVAEIEQLAANVAKENSIQYASITHAIGISLVSFQTGGIEAENAITALRRQVIERRGHLTIARAPRGLRERINVWGPPQSDWRIMKQLKQELDPRGILNPGRFPW